jgi:hypothetical protein
VRARAPAGEVGGLSIDHGQIVQQTERALIFARHGTRRGKAGQISLGTQVIG